MDLFSRISRWRQLNRRFAYLAIFLISGLFFAFLQWQAGFADPDSFYHMKMTMLTVERGAPITEFPWLPQTVLASGFADHHFLYHLILVPFFLAAGPLLGIKIASVLLAAGAIVVFYWLLRAYGLNRQPFLFALLLATSGGFFFRLNLAKTPAVAITWFLLELIALRQKRPVMLFLLAFSHLWLHASWPLLPIIAGLYLLSAWLVEANSGRGKPTWLRSARRVLASQARSLWAIAAGLAAGLVINPFFPQNIRFYWEQVMQVALVNHRNLLPVGTEWHSYTLGGLVGQLPLLFMLSVLTAAGLVLVRSERGKRLRVSRAEANAAVFACLLTALFLAMALNQRRQVEYLAPALTMFCAALFGLLLKGMSAKQAWEPIRRHAGPRFGSPWLMVALAATAWSATATVAALQTRQHNAHIPWNRYERAAGWIRQHVPANALVTNLRWDDFPPLFYHDHGRRWFSGLDPTFSYRADPLAWQGVEKMRRRLDTAEPRVALDRINSRYLFIRRQDGVSPRLSHDQNLKLAYHDHEAIIFELRTAPRLSGIPDIADFDFEPKNTQEHKLP